VYREKVVTKLAPNLFEEYSRMSHIGRHRLLLSTLDL